MIAFSDRGRASAISQPSRLDRERISTTAVSILSADAAACWINLRTSIPLTRNLTRGTWTRSNLPVCLAFETALKGRLPHDGMPVNGDRNPGDGIP